METARARGEPGTCDMVSRGAGQQAVFETGTGRRRHLSALRSLAGGPSDPLPAWRLAVRHAGSG